MRLHVSKDFFVQFAQKTWLSPYSVVKELLEDSFDADATRVIVTAADSYVVVEDDAGMDEEAVNSFLTVGGTHKQVERISRKFRRPLTGKYGVGRLSFLAFFNALEVKTRRDFFHASFKFDEHTISSLASGSAEVEFLEEMPLERNGSEIWLLEPKIRIDSGKVLGMLGDLPILRAPFFEVYVRIGEFKRWSLEKTERVQPRSVLGEKIPVNMKEITGEITIAHRPLLENERGILIVHGGHGVERTFFGFNPSQMSRVTGYVRCDSLTPSFATKSALVEDENYELFIEGMRRFIAENVLPRTLEVKEGMTYMEYSAFKIIDRMLWKVVAEEKGEDVLRIRGAEKERRLQAWKIFERFLKRLFSVFSPSRSESSKKIVDPSTPKPRKPPEEANLSKLGYRVIPFRDEGDEREYFVQGKVIYVNRGHKAYRKEMERGEGYLKRYVLRLVASALASNEYKKSEALDFANRLISKGLEQM